MIVALSCGTLSYFICLISVRVSFESISSPLHFTRLGVFPEEVQDCSSGGRIPEEGSSSLSDILQKIL